MNKKQIINTLKKFNVLLKECKERKILLNCKIDHNRLSCTNLESYIVIDNIKKLGIDNKIKLPFFINLEKLIKFSEKKDKIIITNIKDDIFLKSGKVEIKVKSTIHPRYFPDFPDFPDSNRIFTDDNKFLSAIKEASIFAIKEANRYNYNSVLLDFKNGYIVGTDQIMLRMSAIKKLDCDNTSITKNIITSLCSMIKINAITNKKDNIYFQNEDIILTTRKVENSFVDYMRAKKTFEKKKGSNISNKEMKDIVSDFELVVDDDDYCTTTFDSDSFVCKNLKKGSEIKVQINNSKAQDEAVKFNVNFMKQYLKLSLDFEFVIVGKKNPIIFRDKNGILFSSPVS